VFIDWQKAESEFETAQKRPNTYVIIPRLLPHLGLPILTSEGQ
jgi:hypothetical protein